MFFPHQGYVTASRREPTSELIEEKVRRKISAMAEEIIIKESMKKKSPMKKATKNKIKKMEEFNARVQGLSNFLNMWNGWREMFLDLGPMTIKSAGQATSIEKTIEFANENELDLNIYIGTIHKAYSYKKFNPNFSHGYSEYSLDFYEKFYDDVVAEIERRVYMGEALE